MTIMTIKTTKVKETCKRFDYTPNWKPITFITLSEFIRFPREQSSFRRLFQLDLGQFRLIQPASRFLFALSNCSPILYLETSNVSNAIFANIFTYYRIERYVDLSSRPLPPVRVATFRFTSTNISATRLSKIDRIQSRLVHVRACIRGSSNRARRSRARGERASSKRRHCRANNNLFAIAGVVRVAQTRRERGETEGRAAARACVAMSLNG